MNRINKTTYLGENGPQLGTNCYCVPIHLANTVILKDHKCLYPVNIYYPVHKMLMYEYFAT